MRTRSAFGDNRYAAYAGVVGVLCGSCDVTERETFPKDIDGGIKRDAIPRSDAADAISDLPAPPMTAPTTSSGGSGSVDAGRMDPGAGGHAGTILEPTNTCSPLVCDAGTCGTLSDRVFESTCLPFLTEDYTWTYTAETIVVRCNLVGFLSVTEAEHLLDERAFEAWYDKTTGTLVGTKTSWVTSRLIGGRIVTYEPMNVCEGILPPAECEVTTSCAAPCPMFDQLRQQAGSGIPPPTTPVSCDPWTFGIAPVGDR